MSHPHPRNKSFFFNGFGTNISSIIPAKHFLNVQDLGALGDGETDVTDILQTAIRSLNSTGGVVYLPAGRYITSRSLTIRGDGISIMGDGMGTTVIQLRDDIDYPVFGIIRTAPGRVNKYITVRDLTLDGNRANQPSNFKEHFGFYCGVLPDSIETDEDIACHRVETRNCAGYGFDPHEITTRLHLVDCISHHNTLDGFTIDASLNVIVRGCLSYGNDRHGFNIVTNTRQCVFTNNLIFDNSQNGIMIQNGSRENIFMHNEVYRNSASGISIISVADNVLQNNYIYENGEYGIRLRGCPRTTIVGNRLRNNSQKENERFDEINITDEDDIASSDCMITNNHLTINSRFRSRYAIFEEAGEGTVLQSNNMFAHNKAYGSVRESYRLEGQTSDSFINV